MREYKFRAWDVQKSEMSKPFELGGYPLFPNDRTASYWPKMTLLMQFTGLKDKNGKDIYEGDIIKRFYTDLSGKDGIDIAVVEWDQNTCSWCCFVKADLMNYNLITGEVYEIIGNKFETPLLTEGTKTDL